MSIGKCECLNADVKTYLEGALIRYIRDIQKDVAEFAKAAREYKAINPELSNHYSRLVESQNTYIEKIQDAKGAIKELPICEAESGNPHNPGRLTVPEQHQLKIAKDTLRMPDAMVGVMGGPTKEQAREIIKKLESKK
ncbi:hypothetical protein LCGC14_2395950 [marine sediment metagenome]|uniref:Uncharacterized protein n=1 Tax=marine sediment metagenome TaxID=412755 RepID=A0A0F9ER78_9ZZZZ